MTADAAQFQDPERLADAIIDKVGKSITLALPLGFVLRWSFQNPRQRAGPRCYAGEAPGTDFSG